MSDEILRRPAPEPGLRIAYGPAPSQFGELRLPSGAGPHPTLIVLHGGFWRSRYDLTLMGHLCIALQAVGLATWNLEYRRVGQAGGGWPGTLLDVARGADQLREIAPAHGLDRERIYTLGHSAGGHLALWLAARPRLPRRAALHEGQPLVPAGAISLGGVADLQAAQALGLGNGAVDELLGGSPDRYPQRYAEASPAALLPLEVPQLLIHGTLDAEVPYAIAESYQRAALLAGDRAELFTLAGSDHFDPIDPRSADWRAVREELLRFVRWGDHHN